MSCAASTPLKIYHKSQVGSRPAAPDAAASGPVGNSERLPFARSADAMLPNPADRPGSRTGEGGSARGWGAAGPAVRRGGGPGLPREDGRQHRRVAGERDRAPEAARDGDRQRHPPRTPPPHQGRVGDVLATSTGRAAFGSALTTAVSFVSLAFVARRGMAAIGKLLALGVSGKGSPRVGASTTLRRPRGPSHPRRPRRRGRSWEPRPGRSSWS